MFVVIIMKYFAVICTCFILLCSLGNTNKDKVVREYKVEVMASISTFSQDAKAYHLQTTEKRYDAPNLKLSEESNLCFALRTPVLPRMAKNLSTINILRHYRTLLPEEKSNSLYPSINYVKSTCRYFIYTLGHILI